MFEVNTSRISALDGLRGLAIILVILNHFRLQRLYDAVPAEFHVFLDAITNNGKIGVGLLFMLSGFLMVKIYPQVISTISFYQKRYTRIFPALITMCLALAIIRHFWMFMNPITVTLIVSACLAGAGILWRALQKSKHRISIGRKLFWGFFLSQFLMITVYSLVMAKIPAPVFYTVLPDYVRSILYFLVNATMTLSFGIYVPQLDGVYWSLITEIFFYLMYPILSLPVLRLVQKTRSPILKLLFLCSLFPFFAGLAFLFNNILSFQTMRIQFSVFFIFGMLIAQYEQQLKNIAEIYIAKVPSSFLFALTLTLLLGKPFFNTIIPHDIIIDNLIWVIPTSIAFIIAISSHNSWKDFLSTKPLLILGQLSYALYLTHSIAIEIFVKNGEPDTFAAMVIAIAAAIPLMAVLSIILHIAVEQPYFKKAIQTEQKPTSKKISDNFLTIFSTRSLVILSTVLLGLLWYGFQVPISLKAFSTTHSYQSAPNITIISSEPTEYNFTATGNNLGMLLFHLKALDEEEIKLHNLERGKNEEGFLEVTILEEGTEISKNTFDLKVLSDSRFHPVGLPLVTDSKSKSYTVRIRTTITDAKQLVGLVNNGSTFKSIYFLNTQELLQPTIAISHAIHKISHPFKEIEAQRIIVLILPALLFLLYFQRNKTND